MSVDGADRTEVRFIGRIESALTAMDDAPRQGDEGAPEAWLRFDEDVGPALDGLRPGDEVFLLTWLHRADRGVLKVHPRGDRSRLLRGVFGTRSPHRPNPIGLHRVEITALEGLCVHVRPLEAVDGTPILDVKPVLSADTDAR